MQDQWKDYLQGLMEGNLFSHSKLPATMGCILPNYAKGHTLQSVLTNRLCMMLYTWGPSSLLGKA
jgi:hypothetical protein